jgi:hypothetical protein
MSMKRSILVLVLLFILPLISAVPTFNLFNGDVLCGSDIQTGYSIYANADNGTNQFNVTGSVSASGEYVIVMGATNGYDISFYVDGVFVKNVSYDESLIDVNSDLVLASDHALCYVAPPTDPPPSSPGSPGSPSSPSTPSTPSDPVDDPVDDPATDVEWELVQDGTELDITEQSTEFVSIGGEYALVVDEISYDFSIYAVNSESVKIWIGESEYVIPVNGNVELEIEGRLVLATYLESKDGLAKLSFQNSGVRATQGFAIPSVVYLIFGVIILLVGIFFLIRRLSANKPDFKKSIFKKNNSDDTGLLSGPKE